MSTWGFTQNAFAQSNDKPAQNPPAGQAAGQAAAPAGKRPPQAKTQPEFDAYKAAAALTDAAAQEKAADDFAAKFPDSELRPLLYKAVMHAYQQANNADKMMAMSQKVLTLMRTIRKRCWAWRRCWPSARETLTWIKISAWRKPEKMRSARW
jgi:hypothetical protein